MDYVPGRKGSKGFQPVSKQAGFLFYSGLAYRLALFSQHFLQLESHCFPLGSNAFRVEMHIAWSRPPLFVVSNCECMQVVDSNVRVFSQDF